MATGGVMLVPGFLKALSRQWLQPANDRCLVMIQLGGGNDGLNTVVPYRNDLYYQARPRIAISASEVLPVSDDLGFHPALKGLRKLYDAGHLSVVNNVGYPNPNRSHFRSMDIWHTAANSNEYLTSGWLGRYLDHHCKHPHDAVEVSARLSLAMKGEVRHGMAVNDPRQLYQITNEPWFQTLIDNQQGGEETSNLDFLYKSMAETSESAEYIYETTRTTASTVEYPGNQLGKQLRTVAQFIRSGVSAKVFYVSISGFDTHAGQAGTHERLLEGYDKAISAFVKDLEAAGAMDRTLAVTFSEFGRRVAQNGSNGTDHGTASNLYLIGKQLRRPGFFNDGPDLANLDDNGDLIHTVDFRKIYASVLDDWLQADSTKALGRKFDRLDLL